jgi:hypothetical protein
MNIKITSLEFWVLLSVRGYNFINFLVQKLIGCFVAYTLENISGHAVD